MTTDEQISPPTEAPSDIDGVQRFALAPMSGLYRVSTALMLAGGIVIPAAIIGISQGVAGGVHWAAWLAAALVFVAFGAVTVAAWLYGRPRCFEISAEGMRIVWPARSRKLPAAAFGEIRRVNAMELGRLHRMFGFGGLFGAFGWFRSEYLHNLDAYITRTDGLVYMRLKNRHPLLISPDQPDECFGALKEISASA